MSTVTPLFSCYIFPIRQKKKGHRLQLKNLSGELFRFIVLQVGRFLRDRIIFRIWRKKNNLSSRVFFPSHLNDWSNNTCMWWEACSYKAIVIFTSLFSSPELFGAFWHSFAHCIGFIHSLCSHQQAAVFSEKALINPQNLTLPAPNHIQTVTSQFHAG